MAALRSQTRLILQRSCLPSRPSVSSICKRCLTAAAPIGLQTRKNDSSNKLTAGGHIFAKEQANFNRRFITTSPRQHGHVVPFLLADIGEGIAEVVVKQWFVEVGSHVAQFDQICEVESDKATVTITSPFDGVIRKLHYAIDSLAAVKTALVDIEVEEPKDETDEQNEHVHTEDTPADSDAATRLDTPVPMPPTEVAMQDMTHFKNSRGQKSLATPAVRKMAMENKINLNDVLGSGKDGRILKEDVLKYLQQGPGSPQAVPSSPPVPSLREQLASQQPTEGDRVEPLSAVQKAMMKSMTQALSIPHFGLADEVELNDLIDLRLEMREELKKHNTKLTLMPFFIKAASLALSHFPVLNSSLDEANGNVVYKAVHNIGFAMDTKKGLLVPNIKHVQSKTIYEIAEDLNRLQALGLEGKLGLTDLSGGTFSLSNIGSIGGTYTKPVILPPEVAIGAIGKIQAVPRFDSSDNIYKSQIINVSWSADHRIIDGATMTRFSNLWKSFLENPAKMILHLR